MHINNINVQHFIGLRDFRCTLTSPVTIFAGGNGAGKSSLCEAVRMALTGESTRVSLKKDYGDLLNSGASSGSIAIDMDNGITASVQLPSGKTVLPGHKHDTSVLPFVLDAQRFAALDDNKKRSFLFGLSGLSMTGEAVKERMLKRGCDATKAAQIMPSLKSGFEAASKEAAGKARDEKAVWRTHTGETYGEVKASAWLMPKPEVRAGALEALRCRLTSVNLAITEANQQLGKLRAETKAATDNAALLASTRADAAKYARSADKLLRDQNDLAAWLIKVREARDKAAGIAAKAVHDCPACHARLVFEGGALHAFEPSDSKLADAAAKAALPEMEAALKLLQSAVAHGERDVRNADGAAKSIESLEKSRAKAPDDTEIGRTNALLAELSTRQGAIAKEIAAIEGALAAAKSADRTTANAKSAHEAVARWVLIADSLAPDGIPGELLTDALKPLNDRLATSAKDTGWHRVTVTSDMRILFGGHPYPMLSESEKWRVDAMIAEAVANISGVRLLLLDRFDVLESSGRVQLIAWLDVLARDSEIETALIFGTLKALPTGLPQDVTAFWIEDGSVLM